MECFANTLKLALWSYVARCFLRCAVSFGHYIRMPLVARTPPPPFCIFRCVCVCGSRRRSVKLSISLQALCKFLTSSACSQHGVLLPAVLLNRIFVDTSQVLGKAFCGGWFRRIENPNAKTHPKHLPNHTSIACCEKTRDTQQGNIKTNGKQHFNWLINYWFREFMQHFSF